MDEGASVDIVGFLQRHRRRFFMATLVVGLLTLSAVAVSRAIPPVARTAYMEITPHLPWRPRGSISQPRPIQPARHCCDVRGGTGMAGAGSRSRGVAT